MSEHSVPLLEFRDVSFNFGSREVIRGLSWRVDTGARAALIGPNGAGKTTLLRLACGALQPSAGEVLYNGRSLRTLNATARAQVIALVPQTLEIPFDFTVEQIVAQGRTPHLGRLRGPATTDRAAIDRALALTHAEPLRHRIFNELSGGERQRVKIALGLSQQPRLLLLDEPTQNLDIGRQLELLDLLASLHDQGITIVASIHDLHLVRDNFSSVLLLSDRGAFGGTPAEALSSSRLSKAFSCESTRHPLLREAQSRPPAA